MHLMVHADSGDDIDSARLRIADCDGGEKVQSRVVSVDEAVRDTLIPSYVDADDQLFFEQHQTAEPGCRDVEIELLDDDGDSTGCSTAVGQGLELREDQPVRALLYSRCGMGEEAEVQVEMLQFDSGFRLDCGQSVNICATVDGGGAGVRVNWLSAGGGVAPPAKISQKGDHDQDRGHHVECIQWTPHHQGEAVGGLEAYRARAETTDGGTTAVFADVHEVRFSTYSQCTRREQPDAIRVDSAR